MYFMTTEGHSRDERPATYSWAFQKVTNLKITRSCLRKNSYRSKHEGCPSGGSQTVSADSSVSWPWGSGAGSLQTLSSAPVFFATESKYFSSISMSRGLLQSWTLVSIVSFSPVISHRWRHQRLSSW